MAEYQINFTEMKSKVGIDDVAYSLGYTLNRKAGIGKYFELVLGPLDNPADKIIVLNADKENQVYFRRDGSKKANDVITLIKENIDSFNVTGNNDWIKIANVLAKFANMQPVDYSDRKAVEQARTNPQTFNSDRYEIASINPDRIHWLLTQRGFSSDTVNDFKDFITLIKDKNQKNFDGFNIGFPYRNPESDEITGYEIRGGNGFKSKAAGTDSSNSFWFAEFSSHSNLVKNVYLFESSFDAMAFYQLNKTKLSFSPFALVSMGGAFTQNQVEGVMNRFPNSKLWDCFDNDLAGHAFSKNLVVYAEKIPLDIQYSNDASGIKMAHLTKGISMVSVPADEFNFKEAAKDLGVKYSVGHWKAPANFKDWNDCLLGKKIEYVPSISKRDRDLKLAEDRKKMLLLNCRK